jgi:PASTA domain
MRVVIVIALAALAASSAPAYARTVATHPPAPAPAPAPVASGTLEACTASGARPVTGSFTYTLAAPGSAGGTQTLNVSVGTCSAPVFYPVGTAVTVTENVPTGYSVTSISIGGGQSTISASTPAAGSAVVTIGSGQSLLTFTTSGPPLTPPTVSGLSDCKVPNVVGLGLTAAKAAIAKAHCTLGLVHKAYSRYFRAGHVISEKPRRGTVLAHGAPVDLVLSRGPRP